MQDARCKMQDPPPARMLDAGSPPARGQGARSKDQGTRSTPPARSALPSSSSSSSSSRVRARKRSDAEFVAQASRLHFIVERASRLQRSTKNEDQRTKIPPTRHDVSGAGGGFWFFVLRSTRSRDGRATSATTSRIAAATQNVGATCTPPDVLNTSASV